jgi:hypothetical protein
MFPVLSSGLRQDLAGTIGCIPKPWYWISIIKHCCHSVCSGAHSCPCLHLRALLRLPLFKMEQFEFTVEDLLNLHRGWVTQLYVDERRTEVEIILQLQERRINVS